MPAFISHRRADDAKAQVIASHLKSRHYVNCYLDHFDPPPATTKKIIGP